MNYSKEELSKYRISRSKESIREAKLLSKKGHWNTTANRLYYACFYIVSAYLIVNDISASTHNGVKSKFNSELIKEGKIDKFYGQLYNQLFNLRQDADYRDYKDFSQEKISPLMNSVIELVNEIEDLTRNSS